LALWLLGGCAWHHHPRKSKSYDTAIPEDENDPTYKVDPERAGTEVRDMQ